MTPNEQKKLKTFLGIMRSSAHDGEKLVALTKLTALLEKYNLRLEDLAEEKTQKKTYRDWRGELEYCLKYLHLLNTWEREFIKSGYAKWRRPPTPKQLAKLQEIRTMVEDTMGHG